jgi:hypothetical protein
MEICEYSEVTIFSLGRKEKSQIINEECYEPFYMFFILCNRLTRQIFSFKLPVGNSMQYALFNKCCPVNTYIRFIRAQSLTYQIAC